MSTITVSGLGSGIDYSTWITELVAVKQTDIDAVSSQITGIQGDESSLSTMKSDYTNLQSAIYALSDVTSSSSIFNAKAATSSSSAISASADSTASAQSVTVSVDSLATATTAQSADSVASACTRNTKLSDIANGSITAGTLSIYVNGSKNTISISPSETLGDVTDSLTRLNLSSIRTSVSDGKLNIQPIGGNTVTIGSSTDTSNFTKVMSLTQNPTTKLYSSSKPIFDTSTTAALVGTSFAAGSVTQGTFKIGNAEFTIDSTTTLDSLINKINNNKDAGATASWDPNSGKLKLTATDQGATNINIEAGTSNFTDVMGLTSSDWNDDGSIIDTYLVDGSQTLGTNAVLSINGTSITSSSNTVTSDVSGIKGLTLTLNDKTTSDATINITNDSSAAVTAITNIVNAYNTAITGTKTATAVGGTLHGETMLSNLAQSIRQNATASVSFDNTYKTLSSIGITTGAIGTDVNADTTQLQIDTGKLTTALQNNPTAVMNLLLGNNAIKTNGAFSKIATGLDNSLNPTGGYFTARQSSYAEQVTNLNTKVTNMTADLQKYQTSLETKFQAMDQLISNLRNSSSVFDSYFNNNNNSSSSNNSSSTL